MKYPFVKDQSDINSHYAAEELAELVAVTIKPPARRYGRNQLQRSGPLDVRFRISVDSMEKPACFKARVSSVREKMCRYILGRPR